MMRGSMLVVTSQAGGGRGFDHKHLPLHSGSFSQNCVKTKYSYICVRPRVCLCLRETWLPMDDIFMKFDI